MVGRFKRQAEKSQRQLIRAAKKAAKEAAKAAAMVIHRPDKPPVSAEDEKEPP